MKGSIIVIGSSNTDMVVKTDSFPEPGETKLGGTFFMNSGGKGANQAVASARLGGQVTFIAKIGDDIFGKLAIEGLQKENINTDFIVIEEQSASGIALITVNNQGENSIVVASGANANLNPEDLNYILERKNDAIFLLQLEIPVEVVEHVIKVVSKQNHKIILNPAPAQKLSDLVFENLFLITPNEIEVSILTGIKVMDLQTAEMAADWLLAKGVKNVIITLGKLGAFFKNSNFKLVVPAYQVEAIDTTAAGDVFNGAIAVALSENKTWEDAIQFANRAASLSVTRIGAQTSIPYRKEI